MYGEYLPYFKYVAGGVGVITALYFATCKIISPAHWKESINVRKFKKTNLLNSQKLLESNLITFSLCIF